MSLTNIVETLAYVKKFSGSTMLIKLGGSVLDDMNLVKQLCIDLSLLRAVGIKLVIVHGGSRAIAEALKKYHLESEFVDGLRVTTPEMMSVIEMVLCGQVNKMLVRTLNSVGVSAVGLSGSDSQLLQCIPHSKIHGQVGKVTQVDTTLLTQMLATQVAANAGSIPVIAPIGIGAQGKAFNVNADWAASCIAESLGIKKMFYLTDEEGVCDANGNLVSVLSTDKLQQFIDEGVVTDGMLTKAKTILAAIEQGIEELHVISAKKPHSLIQELFTEVGVGTFIGHSVATIDSFMNFALTGDDVVYVNKLGAKQ